MKNMKNGELSTKRTHQHSSDEANVEAGIFECIGHCKNAGADVAL